jgi:hypothetical protein
MEGKSNPRDDVSRILAVRSGLHPPRKSCAHTVGSIFAHFFRALLPPALVNLDSPCAVGVGNDPETISPMVGTNGGSRNAVPDCIVPERGQVAENLAEPSTKQVCDVFHENVLGSKLANKSGVFRPKTAARSFNANTGSGAADVLAREPAADDIDGNSVSAKSVGCEGSNVIIAGHLWPMFLQDLAGEFLDLAEGDCFKAASALQAKGEATYAGKEIENFQLLHFSRNLRTLSAFLRLRAEMRLVD